MGDLIELFRADLALGLAVASLAALIYMFRKYEGAKNETIEVLTGVLPLVERMNDLCGFLEEKLKRR